MTCYSGLGPATQFKEIHISKVANQFSSSDISVAKEIHINDI